SSRWSCWPAVRQPLPTRAARRRRDEDSRSNRAVAGAGSGDDGRMSAPVTAARPLTGRVILVTRAREQAGRFARLLEEAGGTVLSVPTIAIEPPDSWESL